MTKLIILSLRAIALLSSTWLVAPLAGAMDQVSPDKPPIFIYYIFIGYLFSHEIMVLHPKIRNMVVASIKMGDKPDIKLGTAIYLALMCIRLFVLGKLNEIYFPDFAFNDKTYYYLIVIILSIVGAASFDKILTSFFKKTTV